MKLEAIILISFLLYVAHYTFSASFYVKKILGLKVSKTYKLVDCMPCQSFWSALLITLDPISAAATFLITSLLDRK